MVEITDHELIYKAQAGDRQSFSMLVERHYKLMFRVAWQWCGVQEDAEDIAQEAAIKLAANIDTFKFEASFTTWLYRIIINTTKDYYKIKNRKAAREQPIFENVQYTSPEPSPEQKLIYKDVLIAISSLPKSQREAVVLVFWQGLSHKNAGEVLECPEGTVSWRLHEARKKIAEAMETRQKGAHHG